MVLRIVFQMHLWAEGPIPLKPLLISDLLQLYFLFVACRKEVRNFFIPPRVYES